jgi:hypothetical protein
MTQVISLEQDVLEKLHTLTPEQQQQVLNFIEFLQYQTQKQNEDIEDSSDEETNRIAFQEKLKKYAGCVDGGPGDLSTNKDYLRGKGWK